MQTELQTAASKDKRAAILKAYHDWKWNFPQGIADRTSKEMQKLRLKSKIEELQEAYDKSDEDSGE